MTAYSNVLLVEDDPNDVFLVRRAFEKSKLSSVIHVAKDGEEAIAFLSGAGQYRDRKRFPLPVLVLLDLKLPRKSGFDVLDWLRREPVLKRLPVVILTSSREVKDIDKVVSDLKSKGAEFTITRPPDLWHAWTEIMSRIVKFKIGRREAFASSSQQQHWMEPAV